MPLHNPFRDLIHDAFTVAHESQAKALDGADSGAAVRSAPAATSAEGEGASRASGGAGCRRAVSPLGASEEVGGFPVAAAPRNAEETGGLGGADTNAAVERRICAAGPWADRTMQGVTVGRDPHPLADATAPCGGPASCGCCAVELWREEAARGRDRDGGSIGDGQMAAPTEACKEAIS